MTILFYLMILILFIMVILIIILNLTSKKSFYDREKSSPFECGFDPKNSDFFLIAIIFLSFDVEISLLLPLIMILKFSNFYNFSIISMFYIMVLLIGLYHEWNQGALNWAN